MRATLKNILRDCALVVGILVMLVFSLITGKGGHDLEGQDR